jgi:hypothetical protein
LDAGNGCFLFKNGCLAAAKVAAFSDPAQAFFSATPFRELRFGLRTKYWGSMKPAFSLDAAAGVAKNVPNWNVVCPMPLHFVAKAPSTFFDRITA